MKIRLFSLLLAGTMFLAACDSKPPSQPAGTSVGSAQPAAAAQAPREEVDPLLVGVTSGTPATTRNIYFVIDGSRSMAGKKLKNAKWAVEEFLKKVPPEVNLGLYIFDNSGEREVVPIGANTRDAFLKAVREMQDGGGTPLNPAITWGVDRLVEQYRRQLGYGDFRLVVVTDGEADAVPQAGEYARSKRMPIYTIGIGLAQKHSLAPYSVSYRDANNREELKAALEETLAEAESFDGSFAP